MVGEDPNRKNTFYASMQRIQCKKTLEIFLPRKVADIVIRLGTGSGLILERELAKDEQGDSDAEWTSDQEQTNQMRAP